MRDDEASIGIGCGFSREGSRRPSPGDRRPDSRSDDGGEDDGCEEVAVVVTGGGAARLRFPEEREPQDGGEDDGRDHAGDGPEDG